MIPLQAQKFENKYSYYNPADALLLCTYLVRISLIFKYKLQHVQLTKIFRCDRAFYILKLFNRANDRNTNTLMNKIISMYWLVH